MSEYYNEYIDEGLQKIAETIWPNKKLEPDDKCEYENTEENEEEI